MGSYRGALLIRADMMVLPGMTLRDCRREGCMLPAIYRAPDWGFELCALHKEDGMILRGGFEEFANVACKAPSKRMEGDRV